MASIDAGKAEVCAWIREHFPPESRILDVGAGDGKWRMLLSEYPNMDAVEVFRPNAEAIAHLYGTVYATNIVKLNYRPYDLIIFGDVIEHLAVDDAQMVLRTAEKKCTDMIIAVPFLYPQNEIYGNPWERHIQDDLTNAVFNDRYPGFEVLFDTGRGYMYYHKGEKQ